MPSGLFLEKLPLFRVLEENERPSGDEIHGGLVSGNEKKHHHSEQLIFTQLVTRFFGADQRGEKIVALKRAMALGQISEIAQEHPC